MVVSNVSSPGIEALMESVDNVDGFSVDEFTEEHLNAVLNDEDATALIATTFSAEDQAGLIE